MLCRAAAVGVGATLFVDLWNLLLKRTFGLASLNFCLLGRWIRHMPEGRFAHTSIAQAPARSFECPLGYLAHYSIGTALAVAFVLLAPAGWLEHPVPAPALLFGIGTVVFPYFVMQPAMGLGIASEKTANPTQARLKSLATHLVFGAGLYLTALLSRAVLRP
jgi:hypothetical protein